MSGPMGVMSTKIAIAASALLVSARVDMHEVWAILDPSAPVSRVTPDIARRLRAADDAASQPVTLSRGHVVGLDHEEMRLGRIIVVPNQKRDLVIGSDILSEMALELDFRGGRLRVLERGALQHRTAKMTPVAAHVSADGCLSLAGTGPDGITLRVALDGSAERPTGMPAPVQLGAVHLMASRSGTHGGRCDANDVVLDWRAFSDQVVILDLGNNTLWVSAG